MEIRVKMPNFKQNREAYEIKAGGKAAISYMHKMEGGKCVCGQFSPTERNLCISTVTGNKHFIGTCCINEYLGITGFGGKGGVKIGSYKQLIETYTRIVKDSKNKDEETLVKVLNERLAITKNMYLYEDEINTIEKRTDGKRAEKWKIRKTEEKVTKEIMPKTPELTTNQLKTVMRVRDENVNEAILLTTAYIRQNRNDQKEENEWISQLIVKYSRFVIANPTPGSLERVQILMRRRKAYLAGQSEIFLTEGEAKVIEMQTGIKTPYNGRKW